MSRTTRYPRHLAKYVAARLDGDERCPAESVLATLFETLYFTSLKTDESRPCRFVVNYIDPNDPAVAASRDLRADSWTCVRFDQPLPFDVRTLTKLAEAVDPSVSSLAVFSNQSGRLVIWGLVDQELRYADYATVDAQTIPKRPGLFQAKINGVGNVCALQDYSLIGSLEHDLLVAQYHDVIWSGPIHDALTNPLETVYCRFAPPGVLNGRLNERAGNELHTRFLNAVCRILLHIQHYRHGGGLLITPDSCPRAANVKYRIHYDRLPKAITALVYRQQVRHRLQRDVHDFAGRGERRYLPASLHERMLAERQQLERHKNELLGCTRFIASLSRVDGFVALDQALVVHGFGAELRADSELSEVWTARDSQAQTRLMRTRSLQEFGTRHRAMMRYCYEVPESLGFVISQDSDIRAMKRIGSRLVLWENINVQLAFKVAGRFSALPLDVPSDLPRQHEVA